MAFYVQNPMAQINFHMPFSLLSWVQVDVIVTTAGGIEEDLIKCLGDTYLGDFALPGKELREQGINRWAQVTHPNFTAKPPRKRTT